MKQLPNIITLLRIAGSLGLLLCDVTGVAIWIIYAFCGISDIADGWLARKLKCVTKKGALLDSLADICFVACCSWKLLPILELPQWLWLWAGVIVAIKIANQISALVMYGCFRFPHTLANKATGFLLFIAVPITFCTVVPITIVASVATFAAIQERHYIRTSHPSFPPLLHGATGPGVKNDGFAPIKGQITVENTWDVKLKDTDYMVGSQWWTDSYAPADYWHNCAGAQTQRIVRDEIMADWANHWQWLKFN